MNIFHAHIYFSSAQMALAGNVRESLINAIPQLTYIGNLIPKPIGPHPMPMFEIHLPAKDIDSLIPMIGHLRQGLSVLIHPVQTNELDAHTRLAIWLGAQLNLDVSVLDK
jgi:DOPA 4,5-dioxygenase